MSTAMETIERPCERVSSGHYEGDGYPRGSGFEEKAARKGNAPEFERLRRECDRIGREAEDAMLIHYFELGPAAVDPAVLEAAERAASLFKAWAGPGLGRIKLVFVCEEGDEERRYRETWGVRDWEDFPQEKRLAGWAPKAGFPGDDSIFINADLTPVQVPFVIAHELAHTRQNAGRMTADEREADAEHVAEAFCRKFYPRRDPREILQALAFMTGRAIQL